MHYSARALLCIKKICPKTQRGVIGKLGLEFVKPGIVDGEISMEGKKCVRCGGIAEGKAEFLGS